MVEEVNLVAKFLFSLLSFFSLYISFSFDLLVVVVVVITVDINLDPEEIPWVLLLLFLLFMKRYDNSNICDIDFKDKRM